MFNTIRFSFDLTTTSITFTVPTLYGNVLIKTDTPKPSDPYDYQTLLAVVDLISETTGIKFEEEA